jgi:hypothetical protein
MRAFSILMAGLLGLAMVEPSLAGPKEAKETKEDKGKDAKGKAGEAETGKELARSLQIGGLVFPVFDEKGRLQNYLVVDVRIQVANGKDPWKYREKSHFVRDALLRAAHRKSFHLAGNFAKLDEKLAAAECLRAANEAVGEADALVSLAFTQIDSLDG